jgi:hypothetical protein
LFGGLRRLFFLAARKRRAQQKYYCSTSHVSCHVEPLMIVET